MGGRTSATDASGRPLSQNPDAVRKRETRKASRSSTSSSVGGRGGAESTKGNPMRPDSPFAKAGEPLGVQEAIDQLKYGHIGLAKVLRSEVDLDELDKEFEVAGTNYAYVANHMWTPLRLVIRIIAPLVLIAALFMIWVAIIAETPWIHGVRDWWQRRGEEAEQRVVEQAQAATAPAAATVATEPEQQARQTAPPIPRRAVVRPFRGLRH